MRRSKEDAEQTRQAILDAAEEIFCSQGVAAATLEKISHRAGVTRGALYWHFKDKADLLQALHDRSRPVQDAMIRAAAQDGHEDPLGLLEQAATDMLVAFEQDARQQRMFMIMNFTSPDEGGAAWLRQVNAELFLTLSSLIGQAEQKGELTPDFSPNEVTVIMIATLNGFISDWLRSGRLFPLADLGARLVKRQMSLFRREKLTSSDDVPA
ncbi:TetR family transcriptional regulator [Allitabrizicola rongguiensis]|uniref:TetR family transcriptional regulator n=1 Tax=Alitabrizicola rongguiensis TaxID=2909234 RepID=UPI0029E7FE82|nr:TetR family transcriptional regulator [Tabrizicola rongguiensis]